MSDNVKSLANHRWRDALVRKLKPFVKEGVDEKTLNNVLRGYVPDFYKTRLKNNGDGRWIVPFPFQKESWDKNWWKKEIEDVGRKFMKIPDLDDEETGKIFRRCGWETQVPVENIGILDKRLKWKYDACKNRVAVEVMLSQRMEVYKDAFKFLVGQATDTIDMGVVMVRRNLKRKNYPYLGNVDYDSHPIFTVLPMLKIAFYGF